ISRARMSSERAAVDAAKAADTAMRTESLLIYSSPLLVYDGIVAVWEGVFMLPFLLPPNVGVTRWPPGYSVHGKKKPVNEARCWLQLHRYSAARPARAAGAAFRASWPRSRPLARIPRDFHTALRPKDAGRRRRGGQPWSPGTQSIDPTIRSRPCCRRLVRRRRPRCEIPSRWSWRWAPPPAAAESRRRRYRPCRPSTRTMDTPGRKTPAD